MRTLCLLTGQMCTRSEQEEFILGEGAVFWTIEQYGGCTADILCYIPECKVYLAAGRC